MIPASSFGQAVYGSLYGTVTDNTGAAIPNATVTVTDTNKGTSDSIQTNASGEYRAEHLIPDLYSVKVVMAGFKSSETKGIQVYADQSLKVDAQLQVGGSTESVEVNADAIPLLKTDRADVSTTFTQREVQDLPIGDRNFTNLQLLLPGAQPLGWSHAADENPQGSKQIQVDGQAFGGVAFELDGTDNQDPILGIIVINPPMDALSETKITTQNFDAEFGKAVSSIVTAQTKSGTNKFHGSIFDFRESAANLARDPFTQNPGPDGKITNTIFPSALKNQFGGSIGGPILKDKVFFFGDYQGVRQKVGTSATMTVPSKYLISTCLGQQTSPSGIAGCDFSEYVAAGATAGIYQGGPSRYPSDVIPASQLSPQALALLKLLQPYAPNTQGNLNGLKSNFAGSGTGLFNDNQWDVRGDYQANTKTHVFGRFSRFTSVLSGKTLFGAAGGAGTGLGNYGGNSSGADDSVALGVDIAVTSTLLTDVRLGYYRYNVIDSKYDAGTPFAKNLGIPGLNLDTTTTGAPGFNITDVGSFGGPSNSQAAGAQYGSGLNITRCNCPLIEKEDQGQIVNNWTKIIGNHSLKFGADIRYARNLRFPSDNDRTGLLSFGTGPSSNGVAGSGTGLGFATFVLGDVTSFGRYVSTKTNAKEFQPRDFFYVQDTWRMTNALTVNYGLRYEYYAPERVNGTANGALMDLKTGYLHVAGVGKVPLNMGWSPASFPLNPRVGIAYQLDPKTVIRMGYGRSFDIGVFGSMFGHVVTQNLPILATQSLNTGSPTGSVFKLSDGPVAATFPTVPSNGLLPAPGYAVSPKARPTTMRMPTVDAWNLSVQHSLTPTLSVTLAYVANKGTHTLSAGDGNNTNPNEAAINLPPQYSVTGNALHFDPLVPSADNPANGVVAPRSNGIIGISANGGTSNTNYLSRYYGLSLPACQDPAYAVPLDPEHGITPGRCGWTNGISYYGNDQDSHFSALQVTVAKQMSKGLSLTANYAWQRGIDYGNQFVTWQRNAQKGRNNDIREQQLVLYGLYQLPFGRNKQFASNVPGVVDEIIGGWQISPVMNWSSGLPFTLSDSGCKIPGSVPCYPNGSGKNLNVSLGGYNAQTHRHKFFDAPNGSLPPGFTYAALDTIGTAGRNDAFGPEFFNTDLAVQKNFPIYESVLAQFRMDAFNVFNHINLALPSGTLDQGPQYISSQAPGASPRQLQFSLRVQF
ncbi:MAG TPA: carboxypeptidase regulatory-like domain-containing protein [Acidisarcina sp.]|nr:carboxypeptidase regulatory-like domain-containing protein [Acidisarcina sp.]